MTPEQEQTKEIYDYQVRVAAMRGVVAPPVPEILKPKKKVRKKAASATGRHKIQGPDQPGGTE